MSLEMNDSELDHGNTAIPHVHKNVTYKIDVKACCFSFSSGFSVRVPGQSLSFHGLSRSSRFFMVCTDDTSEHVISYIWDTFSHRLLWCGPTRGSCGFTDAEEAIVRTSVGPTSTYQVLDPLTGAVIREEHSIRPLCSIGHNHIIHVGEKKTRRVCYWNTATGNAGTWQLARATAALAIRPVWGGVAQGVDGERIVVHHLLDERDRIIDEEIYTVEPEHRLDLTVETQGARQLTVVLQMDHEADFCHFAHTTDTKFPPNFGHGNSTLLFYRPIKPFFITTRTMTSIYPHIVGSGHVGNEYLLPLDVEAFAALVAAQPPVSSLPSLNICAVRCDVDPPAFRRAVAGLPETDVLVVGSQQLLTVLNALAGRTAGIGVSAPRGLRPSVIKDKVVVPRRLFTARRFALTSGVGRSRRHLELDDGRLTVHEVQEIDLPSVFRAAVEQGSTVREIRVITLSAGEAETIMSPYELEPLAQRHIALGCSSYTINRMYRRMVKDSIADQAEEAAGDVVAVDDDEG